MTFRSAGIVGLVFATMLACGQARAFPGDSDNNGASGGGRQVRPAERPPADYQYSGNGFNFSMSRNVTQPNGSQPAQDADAEQPQPSRQRPGFFQRLFRGIFGD
ncbi:hypothetical protein [Telmatospirillum siberiense]|uniref:Uncharacterized protein n=1 Tax=Telmatospirillum siberiense TaxID=382514 RepID=A0A2N3PNP3_9PROT|nr:hypothetical protein [Telmatospirillum siberiense]PKU22007.1 hypothetical protein CWS72_23645 [Telmatospirillum siberiense]